MCRRGVHAEMRPVIIIIIISIIIIIIIISSSSSSSSSSTFVYVSAPRETAEAFAEVLRGSRVRGGRVSASLMITTTTTTTTIVIIMIITIINNIIPTSLMLTVTIS